jgi:hypothetical protein
MEAAAYFRTRQEEQERDFLFLLRVLVRGLDGMCRDGFRRFVGSILLGFHGRSIAGKSDSAPRCGEVEMIRVPSL